MKNQKRDQNQVKQETKKTVMISVMILTIFLLILLLILSKVKNDKRQQSEMAEGFHSVQEILEYYNCEFKGMKKSREDNFKVDIHLVFYYDLYEKEKSNEEFYQHIINDVAQFLDYSNFRMLDEEKDIQIEVMGNGSGIQTIRINGIEDYFIYMDSQRDLKKYKEIPTSEIEIQAPELIQCIQNNWEKTVDFGTRESFFQDYDIYFDEGIRVRKISGKIYNVIFTDAYQQKVINDFTVDTDPSVIQAKMGKPTFSNEDETVIGYKSKDIYVFFEKNQISIYRNREEDGLDDFFELVDQFLGDDLSLLDFMNELTDVWPDYEEYIYNQESVFLSYPNKGIDIKINYEDTDGIILYNNIHADQETLNRYLEHTEFVSKLQEDNVYHAEERRYAKGQEILIKCEEYQAEFEKEDTRNRGNSYQYYMKMDSDNQILVTYFISQDPAFVDCQLSENIDSYIWVNDAYFIYSIQNRGIYYYDLRNQVKGIITTGEENYKIISCENGILKYDDQQIELQD